ncbi:hypothetical protein [Amycolatopsis tolypomycina]|uniref:hypothetical protein n=1 Tax=Amycolatopsis tolypomycina TaxID=208445 RepID=UPI0033A307D3
MWARLGLSAGQLADLLDHPDEDPDDCDGELTRTREWCDCEVLANLDPVGWL